MSAWHRKYNVSGTVHCGSAAGIEKWYGVLCKILNLEHVDPFNHMTGAQTVYAFSPIADVAASGWEMHDFHAFVPGIRSKWLQFAGMLESGLSDAGLAYTIVVHDAVMLKP